ncbi:helix-turn-helix domain-containing protein [Natrinema sp. 1APR25-10V2]|uniref:helix-turn-helix domain-containing protein n=1 Tax=Natrinema sp. 1APR25-10V2 TaxID=2951081 RepID=UPI002874F192|nr:helix-turn-helix domain-containing protein [Natrinema sp. 1APR25-10V2]MDS0475988.1 helix-turn-helix domain-containing protein [Natrinema sp. 1APR25-10V2]
MNMRYATFLLTSERGYFHPIEALLREQEAIPERVHAIRLLADGVILALYEVRGTAEQVRAAIDATDDIRYHSLAQNKDRVIIFLETEPEPLLNEVLEFFRTQRVIVDFPVELVEPTRSVLEITQVGKQRALQRIVRIEPEGVRAEITEVGQYNPFENRLFTLLTDRQQEVLIAAHEQGYFDPPREVTHEDIAEQLGCNAATVGHHLMQIQSRLVDAIVPSEDSSGPVNEPGDAFSAE